MRSTDELMQEHRVIERVLAVIDAAAEAREKGGDLPPTFIPTVVHFVRNFADRCHHGKEEDNLFPAMQRRGIPGQDGPIGVMLVEHDRGRKYVRDMEEAGKRFATGDASALKVALDNAIGYSGLLRQHIDKEDNILYKMAERVLTEADDKELVQRFEEVERERIGAGKHEEYLKLVEDLEKEVGISSASEGSAHPHHD